MKLNDKRILVVGASKGLGRALSTTAVAAGASVWGLARDGASLDKLATQYKGFTPLIGDATDKDMAARALTRISPDMIVLTAGAVPTMGRILDQSWENFSVNWQTDVRASFNFGRAAIKLPLATGSTFVTISSGAAINGSFASGGYAGAKRMQWFMSDYLQKEATERELGIRFLTVLPKQQFKETALGHSASSGYAELLGIAHDEFLQRFKNALTPDVFATHVWETVLSPDFHNCSSVAISGAGIERLG